MSDAADRAFAYDSSGKLDHLVVYRPWSGSALRKSYVKKGEPIASLRSRWSEGPLSRADPTSKTGYRSCFPSSRPSLQHREPPHRRA
jgi:hypothetical protein